MMSGDVGVLRYIYEISETSQPRQTSEPFKFILVSLALQLRLKTIVSSLLSEHWT